MLNKGIRSDLATDVPVLVFSDEATKRKMKLHLRDINDVITEKDIKNAKVPGGDQSAFVANTSKKITSAAKPRKKTKKQKEHVVDDTPGNPITPWDILDE